MNSSASSKPTILVQLDTDDQPSVFDSVVAVDAGVDHLFRHSQISPENVQDRVHGAIFTRGPGDLHSTALFVGGSDVVLAEAVLEKVKKSFYGPMRVSVMLDPNGANTTAAAAVLAAGKHLQFKKTTALVLAGTGPVGQRVTRLLAREGANVRVASRKQERAAEVCDRVREAVSDAQLTPVGIEKLRDLEEALVGVQLVIACGAAGVELLPADTRRNCATLRVAIDLNAVPPAGIGGLEPFDKATDHSGVISYGAIGVGGTKMKIHKAGIQKLFTANDLILDADQLYQIGKEMS